MSYELTKEALREVLAEFAAEVTSPSEMSVIFQELGLAPSERTKNRLFFRDDMENYKTMKWAPGAAETLLYVNTIRAIEGDYVLSMISSATLALTAQLYFGAFKPGVHAVELRWWKPPATLGAQGVRLVWSNPLTDEVLIGTVLWELGAWAGPGWTYYDSTGAQQVLPNNAGIENIYDNTWNYLRLACDFENKTYNRLQTCYLNVDLSSLSLQSTTGWGLGRCGINLFARTAGLNTPVYYDDVRLYLDVEI